MNQISDIHAYDQTRWQPVFATPVGVGYARPAQFDLTVIRAPGNNSGEPQQSRSRKFATFALAIAIQAIFVAVWVWTQPSLLPTQKQPLMMVSIVSQEIPQTPEQDLPAPRLETPHVVMTIPVLPEIAVSLPPPLAQTNAITADMTATPHVPAARTREPYEQVLLRVINSHLRYPPMARARHQQGTVTVRFAIDRRGNLLSSAVEKTSRFAALDEESLALLQRAQPLPAPPAEVPGEQIQLVVPINFLLH